MNIYFELKGGARDENGALAPAGVKLGLPGKLKEGVTYQDAISCVNVERLLEVACLNVCGFSPDDVTFITEEEYLEKYGEGEDKE